MEHTAWKFGVRCIDAWAPGAEVEAVRELSTDNTAARVWLIDIGESDGSELEGQRILKVDRRWDIEWRESPEDERHERVQKTAPDWCRHHVPSLLRSTKDEEHCAMLYEISGGSYTALSTAEVLNAVESKRCLAAAVGGLLSGLNSGYDPAQGRRTWRQHPGD
jgi:hypothetical protein